MGQMNMQHSNILVKCLNIWRERSLSKNKNISAVITEWKQTPFKKQYGAISSIDFELLIKSMWPIIAYILKVIYAACIQFRVLSYHLSNLPLD